MSEDVLVVGGDEVVVRVPAAATGGRVAVVEVRMAAGGGPPGLHRHAACEVYSVVEGELAFYVEDEGGEVRRTVGAAGAVVPIAGGREHTIRNESAAAARGVRRLLARRRDGGVRARRGGARRARAAGDGRRRRDGRGARDRDDAPARGGRPRRLSRAGRSGPDAVEHGRGGPARRRRGGDERRLRAHVRRREADREGARRAARQRLPRAGVARRLDREPVRVCSR